VNWNRAVHHVETLAQTCADLAGRESSIFALRVTALWAVGDILGQPRELDTVTVALCVDLPVDEVPWWSQPPGAEHWANATRLARSPVLAWWRSARAPVWNHRIERPALIWDEPDGVRQDALAALRGGRGDSVRSPGPSAGEFRERLAAELAVSLRALRARTEEYDDRRWRPGKLTPISDALWRASDGYLDVLDAVRGDRSDD
jgi:hypothetical protein